MKKLTETERQAQRAVIQYVRFKYPDVLVWATPNGGSRNKIEAANLKKDGVLAGVPDLFVAKTRLSYDWGETGYNYYGLFIEMKSAKGKQSAAQIDVMNKLSEKGYKCEVCYSSEQAIGVIDDYLS